MISIWPDGPRSNAIKLKIPMFDSTDTESLTAAEIRARRRMMGQAAGIAAALCIAHKCDFRSLDHKEVQRVIVERGGVYDLDNYKINRNAGSS